MMLVVLACGVWMALAMTEMVGVGRGVVEFLRVYFDIFGSILLQSRYLCVFFLDRLIDS